MGGDHHIRPWNSGDRLSIDLRHLFIDELSREDGKPGRRQRGSARCYGPPCEIKGCDGRTVGEKPYCLDHVHLMPYAAKIQQREEAREAEISTGTPPVDGYVAQDLLSAIRLTQCSIPALSRDLRVPQAVVADLVDRLRKAGVVVIRYSKRSTYVKLAENCSNGDDSKSKKSRAKGRAKPSQKHHDKSSDHLPKIHPGDVLREDLLSPMNMSVVDLADQIDVSVEQILAVCDRMSPITKDIAEKLAKRFNTGVDFWINLQSNYDAG